MLLQPTRAILFQIGGLALFALLAVVLGQFFPLDQIIFRLGESVARHQPWSTVLYPLALAAANLLLLPGGLLIVGGGFFFGLKQGFLLVLAGNLVGAAVAFYITRRFARGWVEQRFLRNPKWRALDLAIAREGWKIVFLTQLNPLSPTSLINYFYGATRMRFGICMLWITIGQVPGMFLYAYLGSMGRFSWKLWREGAGFREGAYWLWLAGLFLALALTIALARIALRLLGEAQSRALAEHAESPGRTERAVAMMGSAIDG
jgi:uncharacterized membrane protein YdjX (TVP38/TMEM64 family)